MSFRQTSIRRQLMGVILLTATIVLLVTSVAFTVYETISLAKSHAEHLLTLAHVIGHNSAALLSSRKPEEAKKILAALKAEPDIRAAALYDHQGKLFVTLPEGESAAEIPPAPGPPGHRLVDRHLILFQPIADSGVFHGTLYLRSSLSTLDERLRIYAMIALGVMLVSFYVGYFFSNLLQEQISKPVLALAETARTATERHDYSVRAPKLADGELGLLTEAFNRMLEEIQQRKTALEKSEARFRGVVESSLVGFAFWHVDGHFTEANEAFLRLLGYSREEIQAGEVRWRDLASPELRAQEELVFPKLLQTGSVPVFERVCVRKDGTPVPVLIGAALLPGSTNEGIAYLLDMTELRRVEHALCDQTERLRAVVETAVDGIITINERGLIETVNPAVQRIFGYLPEEMLGQNVKMLMPEPFRREHDGYIHRYSQTGQRKIIGIGREVQGQRKDGGIFPLDLAVSETRLNGRLVFTGLVRDITARKEAEIALQNAHEQIQDHAANLERIVAERTARLRETIDELEGFSYSLSHDMRAPLRAMRGFSEIIMSEQGHKLDAHGRDCLERVISAAGRLDRLIQDVLTYSQAARTEIKLEPVDLEKLLEQLIQENTALQSPQAELCIEGPLPAVLGHEASLTQCLTNLLTNAVKFMPPNRRPQVRIRSELVGDQVRLWVEDNGIGIPPEAQRRLFGLFQRLHRGYEGTGIGLSIVRKAVERMGGSVGMESEPDQGSRFWLQLNRSTP